MSEIDTPAADVADTAAPAAGVFATLPASEAKPAMLACASVSARQAVLSRLIKRGCYVKLPMLEPNAVFSIQLVPGGEVRWADSMTMSGPCGPIELADGARLLRALSGIDIGDQAGVGGQHWEWLQAALVGRLSGTPFECIDRISVNAPPELQIGSTLRITLQTGCHKIVTSARASTATWVDLLQRIEWTHDRLSASGFLDLPIETVVRIARHTLPGHVLDTLVEGDIIVPDSPSFTCDGRGLIQVGNLNAQVHYQAPCQLQIKRVETKLNAYETEEDAPDDSIDMSTPDDAPERNGTDTEDPVLKDDSDDDSDDYSHGDEEEEGDEQLAWNPSPEPSENEEEPRQSMPDMTSSEEENEDKYVHAGRPLAELDRTPVTVDFELGKMQLSLADLRTMGAGMILPLTGGTPASIKIVSAGRVLGIGEVVDVDGQLGIRITEWGTT